MILGLALFSCRTSASVTRRASSTSTRELCTSTAWWRGRWWVPRCSPKSTRQWSSWSLALFRCFSSPQRYFCCHLSRILAGISQPLTPAMNLRNWHLLSSRCISAGFVMWLFFLMLFVVRLAAPAFSLGTEDWKLTSSPHFTCFYGFSSAARERHPDHGAAQLLLPLLPSSRDPAHLHLPSNHFPHSGGFCELPGPRTQRGVWKWLKNSFMLAEGANEDHQGFCTSAEKHPHALALQLKYLF